MSTHDVDRTLARLRAASDRIGANLVDFECDPDRALLEAASLQGASRARWDEARSALGELFRRHAQLVELLDEASAIRGARGKLTPDREHELASLLEGPSIEMSTTKIPLGERHLLGQTSSVERCTPDELLTQMAATFDRAKVVVAEITAAWELLVDPVRRAREDLTAALRVAAELSDRHADELAELDTRLTGLGEAVLSDPLAVDCGEIETIAGRAAALREELDDALRLRTSIESRLNAARALLGKVEAATAAAQEAYSLTVEKIADAHVPEPSVGGPALALDFERMVEHAQRGEWTRANRELEKWSRRARDLLRVADEQTGAMRAPIDERNELRGRLDAYRAKARAVGLLERSEVAAMYVEARTALYTAPTDLAEAGELVRRYQHAVSSGRAKEVSG